MAAPDVPIDLRQALQAPLLRPVFCLALGVAAPLAGLSRTLALLYDALESLRGQWRLGSMLGSIGRDDAARTLMASNSSYFWWTFCTLLLDAAFTFFALKIAWAYWQRAPRSWQRARLFLLAIGGWIVARDLLLPGLFDTTISGDWPRRLLLIAIAAGGYKYLEANKHA